MAANLSRISDVPQQLKSRDEELIKVDEEKERLQTRLTGLEIQYEKMLKESRLEQVSFYGRDGHILDWEWKLQFTGIRLCSLNITVVYYSITIFNTFSIF